MAWFRYTRRLAQYNFSTGDWLVKLRPIGETSGMFGRERCGQKTGEGADVKVVQYSGTHGTEMAECMRVTYDRLTTLRPGVRGRTYE